MFSPKKRQQKCAPPSPIKSKTESLIHEEELDEDEDGSVAHMLKILSTLFVFLMNSCLHVMMMPAFFLKKAHFNKRPSPSQVLLMGSPKVCVEEEDEFALVNSAVAEEIRLQLLTGRQLGLHVVAYYRGKLVVDVVGGVRRSAISGEWTRLEKDALFMSFSVCKGVSATALMTAVDRGHLSYEQPVSSLWPEFGEHGKEEMTVETAVSHRDGVRGLLPMRAVVPILMRSPSGGSSCSKPSQQAHHHIWEKGTRWVESYKPDFQPGTRAMYNPVTWSWIIGGIMERATGKSIHDTVQTEIAAVLGTEGDMYLGMLPEDQLPRVALREPTLNYTRCKKEGLSFLDRILAVIEASVLCAVGNAKWWSHLCLPSSNGYFTTRSIAKMYGALANGGVVYDGSVERKLVSPNMVNSLLESLGDESKMLHHPASAQVYSARMSRGYGPWQFPSHQGENAPRCFGHSGLGGCVGFSDPDESLAICVMKTGYEPHCIVGAEGSPDAARLCRIVREALLSLKK